MVQRQPLLGCSDESNPVSNLRRPRRSGACRSTQQRRRHPAEVKNLTLWFEGESLARWEGDYFPEQDSALAKEMARFGNLPKEKPKGRGQ